MEDLDIRQAAIHFGLKEPFSTSPLSSGLIHQTYHAWGNKQTEGIVLQQINEKVFPSPHKIANNYSLVYKHLCREGTLQIPEPLQTSNGQWLWMDKHNHIWRANVFIENSYTENLPITANKARRAARSFAKLTQALKDLDPATLSEVLPGFHNLAWRFDQFQQSLSLGSEDRLRESKKMMDELIQRKNYVDFYTSLSGDDEFKLRIMHHDCKLSNVLFHQQSGEVICPIDLDTLMSGYYFSDLGDMVRSMAASEDESEKDVRKIFIRKEVYKALVEGYLENMVNVLTQKEKTYVHHSGLLIIYMQAMRFLTDYLQGDIYYKTSYSMQNYDRARNQLALLGKLETFLWDEYQYVI
jgi:hypothetical protein